jgi:ribosomal protein S14
VSKEEILADRESPFEVARREELDQLRAFKRRVDSWLAPQTFYALYLAEYEKAKSPTATNESCTRAGLTACLYRAFELCARAVPEAEAEKIRRLLPR